MFYDGKKRLCTYRWMNGLMDGGREREREEGKEGRRDGLVGTYMAGLVVSLDDNLPCTQALLYYSSYIKSA